MVGSTGAGGLLCICVHTDSYILFLLLQTLTMPFGIVSGLWSEQGDGVFLTFCTGGLPLISS